MELTLKNYKTKLSAELLKRSLRCQVRECDELSPGVFESYVDEQDSSFDVKLSMIKNVVSTHSCECESNAPFCQHKIALLNYIATGIKPSAKILAKKKIDPVRQALEDADHEKLKDWLFATLKKNKDLSIAFTNEFLTRTDDYDPREIIVLTMDAVKAVINKRSRAEATEVKKIVDLWSAIHRPILDKFLAEPTSPAYFAQVHAVIDTCDNCKYRISTNSKRFEKYIKDIKDELSAAISIIREDESWSKSLSYFFLELFHEGYYGIRRAYVNLIVSVFNSSATDRRKKINEMFVEIYQNRSKESKNDAIEILKLVLDMVIANNEFVEHKEMFVPIRHSINYNLKLIDNLMKIGELGKAEMFCIEQVNSNTNQEYDWAYTSRLKHIYTETNNEKKLIHLISDELLRTPDSRIISWWRPTSLKMVNLKNGETRFWPTPGSLQVTTRKQWNFPWRCVITKAT